LKIDQFEWTQHDQCWKDDFRRAREELGLDALRYALPWHKIEMESGRYDWAAADERVQFASEIKLDLYLDVMHFGTPLWLRQAAGDPEFPEALERFAGALVERYRGSVRHWCPCNEPLILALFSGDFGFWPPHSRKWTGYMPVLSRVMQATSRAMRAIRRADPEAKVILCDNVEHFKCRGAALREEVARRNLRRFLAMDLLLGRVDRRHPLFEWVTGYGLSELDLDWFAAHPQTPDVLGIDYYPNSEWQLESSTQGIQQRRCETPVGLFGIARAYYQRYGLPMMLTETSADGHAINREIWLEQTVDDCRRLREEGIPMLGYFWWPMIDQIDWDGALTHRIGKIHDVGVFNLKRDEAGCLTRQATPLVEQFSRIVRGGDEAVGKMTHVVVPADESEQDPPIGSERVEARLFRRSEESGGTAVSESSSAVAGTVRTNGHGGAGTHGKKGAAALASSDIVDETVRQTDRYGIVVFSHLRWGFVWQRPQQFLSRFARKHKVLFVEEPFFDLPEGAEPRLDFHKVMPNVTVICPHLDPSWRRNGKLPMLLRKYAQEGIEAMNDQGEFDRPLLWYYSPMDSAWSLGHFANRGVVYDCMDELSNFTGAPPSLQENEARLMRHADIVFTGGYELGDKKRKLHPNVHTFGCGVDYAHFAKAGDAATRIPPDIDFMKRPVLGWFGVVDERVDYAMVGEMARMRPAWSFAMVGPVVKVDPNLLPHAPNLYWLGGRDYQQLPNYCRAFDINMMCFAINAATEFINPTKGLEYMATGKPIISTPVRDVVRQWSDIVRVARTAEEFVAAADDALRAGGGDERIARGIELAKRNSWDTTVESMRKLIRDAIGARPAGAARQIDPLNEAELEYAYRSTQGS
jgi:beta-glucosidase/6-phospho-beta-glucosidase/beta-galactosidase/glycosyltransferase involved in cell wall biosynthesis